MSQFYSKIVYVNCSGECPLECENVRYGVLISYATFPTEDYYRVMMNQNNLFKSRELVSNRRELDKKVASLNVYYDDLSYTSIKVQYEYETL